MSTPTICMHCGESVALGSGKYVNRIPSLDTRQQRADNGAAYPDGAFICADCDIPQETEE